MDTGNRSEQIEEMTTLPPDILTDEGFSRILEIASKDFFKMYRYLNSKPPHSKKCYSSIHHISEILESFLDDHGARKNKTWFYFTELVASIRNISIATFHLRHLMNRYTFYKLDELNQDVDTFHQEANDTMRFFSESILALFTEACNEGTIHHLTVSSESFTLEEMQDITAVKTLKKNSAWEEIAKGEEKIVEFARRYRKAAKIARFENIDYKLSSEEIKEIIPLKINENKMQKLKNIIHGVQSDYDTYVSGTKMEFDNKNLLTFRGYISIPLHLMTVLIMLSHFFERHENEIRQGDSMKNISRIIDKNKVLDCAINFAFYHCNTYLQKGNEIAELLLTSFVMKERHDLPIPIPLGFHARPSTYVSLIVNEHGTDVFLLVDGIKFNAKSVLNLMEAGGIISDKGIKIVTFEGDKRVLDDLSILAKHNYCEDGEIPRELNYLRILRN